MAGEKQFTVLVNWGRPPHDDEVVDVEARDAEDARLGAMEVLGRD